jgi:hypothetical protein
MTRLSIKFIFTGRNQQLKCQLKLQMWHHVPNKCLTDSNLNLAEGKLESFEQILVSKFTQVIDDLFLTAKIWREQMRNLI